MRRQKKLDFLVWSDQTRNKGGDGCAHNEYLRGKSAAFRAD